MSFTDIFIRRPVLASVVSLLILLIGLASVFNLSVRQYPRITNTTITVTTAYPGANADLIKGFITTPIQQAVASAEGIDTLTSSSQQNYSLVTLNLRLDANPDRAVADVLSKIQQVKSVLPRESQDPIVVKQTGETTALMYLSFNSKVMTGSQITDYLTRVVQPRLQTINGVANAQILGGQTFAMRIWLNPDKMAALGVTRSTRSALANNNHRPPRARWGDLAQTTINAETALDNPGGLGKLVVVSRGDALIRLYDIATIELGPESADLLRLRWLKAVFIGISPPRPPIR
jgi:multidrug efflux pump